MTDRTTCVSGKVRHPDEETARIEKNRANKRAPKHTQKARNVYHCPWCSGWHATKQKRKASQ